MQTLRFRGMAASPYSRKMRALLRYRRIAYEFIHVGSAEDRGLPEPKVRLLPTFFLPNAAGELEAVTDSTPLIRRFEREIEGRQVVPPDPAMAFIDYLLEDYADEWLTKCMFHFRWAHAADAQKASDILPRQWRTDLPERDMVEAARSFREHQVGRLHVVGSNETTGPLIEESYRVFLRLFDAHLQQHPFLMGARPGASDFAVFGQLTQLALFDPTPVALTLEISPRTHAWVERTEDLSGIDALDDQWLAAEELPGTLTALLAEVGRVYAPVMQANLEALERGDARMQTRIDGRSWEQPTFPYQGKCLRWLRQERAKLPDAARRAVDRALEGSGCEALFQESR